MLFSFAGPRSGRILTAYFDGEDLIVQHSPIYSFPAFASDAMREFVRHQAAEVAPGLKTTRLPSAVKGAQIHDSLG